MVIDGEADLIGRLLPCFRPYVGQEWTGPRIFDLLCSVPRCYRKDTVTTSRQDNNEKQLRRVCEKFIAKGWSFRDGPICPDCRVDRRPMTK